MAFPTMDEIEEKFVGQPYNLNSVLTPAGVWAKLDAPPEQVRTALNVLINALNSVVDGASGADNTAMTPISAIGAQATVQSIIEAIVTRLQATTTASGAKFLGAETIAGLSGNDVQTLLSALKTLADGYDTAQSNALNTHKSSSDHDGRYFTETEIGATADGASGADKTGATQVASGSGTTVQTILEWLYVQIVNVVLGQIPDGSLATIKYADGSVTIEKLSFDPATQVELDEHKADDVNHVPYAVATGSANTYAVTLSPAPTSYVDGMAVCVKINVASTGASAININALGAKPILDSLGNAITSGGLKAGLIYSMRYNSTTGNFIVQGKGGGGNAIASQLAIGATATVDSGPIVGTFEIVTTAGTQTVVSPTVQVNVTTSTSLVKTGPRFTAKFRGTVRIRFSLATGVSGTSTGQIYKNGAPVGISRSTASTSWVQYTEDFSCNVGDYFEVYAKISVGGDGAQVLGMYFNYSENLIVTIV